MEDSEVRELIETKGRDFSKISDNFNSHCSTVFYLSTWGNVLQTEVSVIFPLKTKLLNVNWYL
jgi:hypothetical protein